MVHRIRVRGVAAQLRWGYHEAARLGPWSIDGGALTATILTVDAFRISQHPMTFVVPRANGSPSWRWLVEELQIAGGTLTARLGPPE